MSTPRLSCDDVEPLVVREVNALIKYASERSLDPEGGIIYPLISSLSELLLAESRSSAAVAEDRTTEQQVPIEKLRARVIVLYSQLTKLSYPVTGRTLIQTAENFGPTTLPLKLFTLLFLTLAIGNEVLKSWLGDMPEPEDGWLLFFVNLHRYVFDYCALFIWGALGSMAYILKRLTDYAEEHTFDQASSHGWTTRIFLGAMLGGIVQFIYDPSVFINAEAGFKMSASALGFLTGVGVKVVYGAIEKTIDTLATKMNLDAISVTKNDTKSIRVYLNEQLAKIAKQKEPEKRKLLLELMDDLVEPKKPE
jgi:hypothetical protein